LAAGLPEHVPAATIDRRCGSSQQALHFAAQGIMAGSYDIAVAGGVESMSRVPMGAARLGVDPYGPSAQARYGGLVSQGVSAELVAAKWKISREAQDHYALGSHVRAESTRLAGSFDDEIIPIDVATESGTVTISTDETIRPDTTLDRLASLRPAFVDDEMADRFPQINWSVTAGNSSQLADGASALLVMEEKLAEALDLQPLARVVGMSVVSDDPIMMLSGPIPATRRVIERSGIPVDDIEHFEVNEAFAPVPLAWQKEFHVDPDLVNPRGGAIALGHPLGGSGTRLTATLLHAMRANAITYGLQTMCEAGGMANATIFERL
jgi:acetyl-CoA acyltransferase